VTRRSKGVSEGRTSDDVCAGGDVYVHDDVRGGGLWGRRVPATARPEDAVLTKQLLRDTTKEGARRR
jgi:hypothetical protein